MSKPLVGIIMGSDSDLPVMSAAAAICEEFEIEFELDIVSAHRTPEKLVEYSKSAEARGLKVIIAGAGGAAHLPGMVASETVLPVIGVPVKGSSLEGMDSLLSIVQMPGGVPVATVAINGAKNAGILAAQIIGSSDSTLREKIALYKQEMKAQVDAKSEKLKNIEYKRYLKEMGN
ncbi:5-(carboxyamino)imidazole ribonucleotide mutase [Sulfurimonas aquatica]|uniref:N5-carboxyaminoimidazole ribonucleotide mutase n=1 Tax=Sulfurimonas aquatica TaxID=2672570 RepID=A0A975GDN5_9BACT|nr:5-(carboxyamino)imidazole ribonucleotide mutase [Sulfurimonas aquatica]QSZ42548.1 5-(carboxyamino)imidazole ribonucleotide mutase [Sulfurimonas aquatica]